MRFLYPPRPELAISPDLIEYYENKGWWAQVKKNGTLQVISIDKKGNVEFRTRHNEPNKAWKPTEAITKHFAFFKDSVFVGELLHNKHPSVKNMIYLFDVLRLEGKAMTGITTEDRMDILEIAVPEMISGDGKVSHARWFKNNLFSLYTALHEPIDEGLVLKDPNAKLRSPLKESINSASMVKVRKETKNYGF